MPDRFVSDNQFSSVTLDELAMKPEKYCNFEFQQGSHTLTDINLTRFDVYETLCPQQMLVHKGGRIKNCSGECKDIIPTKLQCRTIQRTLQSPNL